MLIITNDTEKVCPSCIEMSEIVLATYQAGEIISKREMTDISMFEIVLQ